MSVFLRPSGPALRDPTPRELSACLYHWEAALASIDTVSGVPGVFARAGTLASITDGLGTTFTAPHSMPGFGMVDADGDTVREALALWMGTTDFLHHNVAPPVQALSFYLDFIETGARSSANATLFAICNDAVSGGRFWIDTSGSYYRANYNNGVAATAVSTLTVGQPTSGQRVRLFGYLLAGGQLRISQRIGAAAQTDGNETGPLALLPWGAGAKARINSRGDTENPAQGRYRRAKLVPGLPSFDVLEALR